MSVKQPHNSPFVVIIASLLLVTRILFCSFANAEERQRSLQEIQSLAENGDSEAQLRLAEMYQQGNGVRKDDYQACLWAQTALLTAGYHDNDAGRAGRALAIGTDVAGRLTEAQTEAAYSAAQKKFEQLMQSEARNAAAKEAGPYEQAAEAGDPEAQFQVAEIYDKHDDYDTALRWYQKAAEQDHYMAQVKLSSYYYEGPPHAATDYEQAYYWDLRAADGDERATHNPVNPHAEYLAKLAARIDSAKLQTFRQEVAQRVARKDSQRRTRAEQGDPRAQYELGYMYDEGIRAPQDYSQSFSWFRKSAEQGFALAFNYMGGAYYFGHGVEKNGSEAVRWYRKAAECGDVHTQSWLGDIYSDGIAVPKDSYQAYFWLALATSHGDTNKWDGKNNLRDVVVKELTPDQIAQAERDVAAWKPTSECAQQAGR